MEQFNLDTWLQDKSRKVVTREGKGVEIIHTNSPVPHHPIVGFIDKSIYTWTIDGKLIYGKKEQDKNDLFFADEEELTEFEKEVAEAYEWTKTTEREDFVNEFAPKLLDLARKEILKDLPKWKKATEYKEFEINEVCILDDDIYPIIVTNVNNGEYYIELDELKNLPLEE